MWLLEHSRILIGGLACRFILIRRSLVSIICWLTGMFIDCWVRAGFMSSLDLHTHSGFQASLKEAFAIVCAPSQSPKYVQIFNFISAQN